MRTNGDMTKHLCKKYFRRAGLAVFGERVKNKKGGEPSATLKPIMEENI